MEKDSLEDLSMKPTRDDLLLRQSLQPKHQRLSSRRGSLTVTVLMLLLVVIGGAGAYGGWYLWQEMGRLQGRLAESARLIEDSQTQLGSLQNSVQQQTSSQSQEKGQLEKELQLAMSEIRKLWDVSNKRNKANIQENRTQLAKLEKTLAGLSQAIDQQKAMQDTLKKTRQELAATRKQLLKTQSSVNSLQTALQDIRKSTAKAEKSAAQAVSQAQNALAQIKELSVQNQTLKTMLLAQEDRLKRTTESVGGNVEGRIEELESAIRSIDVYRKQVNRRLDQLDAELARLRQ